MKTHRSNCNATLKRKESQIHCVRACNNDEIQRNSIYKVGLLSFLLPYDHDSVLRSTTGSVTLGPRVQLGVSSVPVLRQSPRSPAESVLNDKVLITSRVPQLANCPPAHPLSDWPGRRNSNATKGPSRTFLEGAPPSASTPTPAVSGT